MDLLLDPYRRTRLRPEPDEPEMVRCTDHDGMIPEDQAYRYPNGLYTCQECITAMAEEDELTVGEYFKKYQIK